MAKKRKRSKIRFSKKRYNAGLKVALGSLFGILLGFGALNYWSELGFSSFWAMVIGAIGLVGMITFGIFKTETSVSMKGK